MSDKTNDPTSADAAAKDFPALLIDILGYACDEFVSLGYDDTDGVFHTAVMTRDEALEAAAQLPATANCYFGVNPISGPARKNAGRGTEKDVTRLAGLWVDLDVKAGACPSLEAAWVIVDDLAIMLGTRPSMNVESGGGLHAYWPVSDGHIRDGDISAPRALLKRWRRLVGVVADRRDVKVDNVYDLARMLRLPGSSNNKTANPRPVKAFLDKGHPLTVDEIVERLDEAGIFAQADEAFSSDEVLAPPAGWQWAEQTCPYVTAMTAGFATDAPRNGRNPWLLSQKVRMTCAYRLGCITEADYAVATEVLEKRFVEVCKSSAFGDPREPKKYEFRDINRCAIEKVAKKTDEQVRAELGGHTHGNSGDTDNSDAVCDVEAMSLDEARAVFRRWFGNTYDTQALDLILAAVAAERFADGSDPLWVLIVGGPGAAKTESVQPLTGIGAIVTSALSSEAALLSATPKKERSKDATGGLLRKIGGRGILVIKDVTSILSMHRDLRARVLAALREIYDGSWYREVGTDGGQTISWHGRIAVIGAVTTAWDAAHSVISSMGDRFVLLRLDSTRGRQKAGRQAIGNTGDEAKMRAELARAVAGVLAGVQGEPITPTDAETDVLLAAADLVTLARTAVEYNYAGEVIDAHAPEMPTRFAKQLSQILRGAVAVGMDRTEALHLAIRCARDSMPPLRLAIIDDLAANSGSTTTDVRKRINKPRNTVDRQLQALHMLGVLAVEEMEYTADGKLKWFYSLAEGINPGALKPLTVPEMSVHTPNPIEEGSDERSQAEGLGSVTDISGTQIELPVDTPADYDTGLAAHVKPQTNRS